MHSRNVNNNMHCVLTRYDIIPLNAIRYNVNSSQIRSGAGTVAARGIRPDPRAGRATHHRPRRRATANALNKKHRARRNQRTTATA